MARMTLRFHERLLRRARSALAGAAILLVGLPPITEAAEGERRGRSTVAKLHERLLALSPTVRSDEAKRVAIIAHEASQRLGREYRVAGPAHFHNFLVNAGLKKRGLCHHWARDLGGQLAGLKLRSLVLRWGIARGGTLREHNAVVVTARGQPFERGIVLDPWRHSGRLFFGEVVSDRYPWREDPHESFTPPVAERRQAAR